MKKLLAPRPRDLAIFTVGINTGLRASDLVRLTVGDLRGVKAGEDFRVVEQKSGKARLITVNGEVAKSVCGLLAAMPGAEDGEPLFRSRKHDARRGYSLSVGYLVRLVKGWCADLHLKGNFGSHTLRKTFGCQHRQLHNTSTAVLCRMFNHSSERQTLRYLGLQEEDIREVYLKEV
jgi:integrase